MSLSNNSKFSKAGGAVQKGLQQGRRAFGTRSVRSVREHDKGPRTPLAGFFNSPLGPMANIDKMSSNRRRGSHGWGDEVRSSALALTAFEVAIAS